MSLDHDGNGEVDFEEFLHLMTNTDLFIAAISDNDTDEMRKRGEHIVFTHVNSSKTHFSHFIRCPNRVYENAGAKRRAGDSGILFKKVQKSSEKVRRS